MIYLQINWDPLAHPLVYTMVHSKFIVSSQKEEIEYDQEMPQSHATDQPVAP